MDTGCKLVANAIQIECFKLEPVEDNEDELIGSVRPRRRLMHTRSEIRIREKIDGTCRALGDAGGMLMPDVMAVCLKLTSAFAEDLETVIYEHGPKHIKRHLCTNMAAVCSAEQTFEPDMYSLPEHFKDGEL
mmetsp:Transcript_35644/g.68354  ORF Transcript_35644/g.68354 Transcript_35644/m.68354 type:complete len:132 (-) Transcript_35644:952-1347(-)